MSTPAAPLCDDSVPPPACDVAALIGASKQNKHKNESKETVYSITTTTADPPRDEPASPTSRDVAANIVVCAPSQSHSERRQQRRAAKKRLAKSNRSPEEKVEAAEAFLKNITNQAAAWPRRKAPSSQRPARLAYKAARREELENEAQAEAAALATAFQGCGYFKKLTERQIK